MLKIYTWFSGVLVAFLATYLTGVLTTVVPAPKALLCKLSLGFCPAPEIISFGATDIDRIIDHDGVGQGIGENEIGMLHNRVDQNDDRPNMVKYRFTSAAGGAFDLHVLYASPNERPVTIAVNDIEVDSSALKRSTNGTVNKDRQWSPLYRVTLRAGENTLMFKRSAVFPHLSKIELTQAR